MGNQTYTLSSCLLILWSPGFINVSYFPIFSNCNNINVVEPGGCRGWQNQAHPLSVSIHFLLDSWGFLWISLRFLLSSPEAQVFSWEGAKLFFSFLLSFWLSVPQFKAWVRIIALLYIVLLECLLSSHSLSLSCSPETLQDAFSDEFVFKLPRLFYLAVVN